MAGETKKKIPVTVITLFRENIDERFVGVVFGRLTKRQKMIFAREYHLGRDFGNDKMSFSETFLARGLPELITLRNAERDGVLEASGEEPDDEIVLTDND